MSVIGPTALLQSMHPTFAANSETDHASVQHSGDVTERIQILPPARSDRTATEHASNVRSLFTEQGPALSKNENRDAHMF